MATFITFAEVNLPNINFSDIFLVNMFFDTLVMKMHLICVLFFIYSVSKSSPKISLTFGWKRRLCVIIHVSFFSSFLLLFLVSPHLNFSSSLAPSMLLSPLLAFCISSTLPLHFLLPLPLYMWLSDLSLYVLHSFASRFFFSLSFRPLLPTLSPAFSVPFYLFISLSDHSECGSGASAESLPSASL